MNNLYAVFLVAFEEDIRASQLELQENVVLAAAFL